MEAWEGEGAAAGQASQEWGGVPGEERQQQTDKAPTMAGPQGHPTSQRGPFTDPFPPGLPATCSMFWMFS